MEPYIIRNITKKADEGVFHNTRENFFECLEQLRPALCAVKSLRPFRFGFCCVKASLTHLEAQLAVQKVASVDRPLQNFKKNHKLLLVTRNLVYFNSNRPDMSYSTTLPTYPDAIVAKFAKQFYSYCIDGGLPDSIL